MGLTLNSAKIKNMVRVDFKYKGICWCGKHLYNAVLVLGILLMMIIPVQASVPNADQASLNTQVSWPTIGEGVSYLRFDHLGVREGLSESGVLAIFQDSQGFLWFGTREGLNKYDGYIFNVYQADPHDPDALADAHITALAETPDGILWVGTYFGGMAKFDRVEGTFNNYRADPSDPLALPDARVNTLLVDSDGTLWVGTRAGLSQFIVEQGHFTHYPLDLGSPGHSNSTDVRSLYEDENKNLWVGTGDGLFLLSTEEDEFQTFLSGMDDGLSTISSICGDGLGGLWLGTSGGLVHFNTQDFTYRTFRHDQKNPESLSSEDINTVFRDRSGGLWIGFEDKGVNFVREVSNKSLRVIEYAYRDYDPDSLSHNEVFTIFEDRGGVIWIGTRGGVNKVIPATRTFGYFRHHPDDPTTLSGDDITALAFDQLRRSLWVGMAGAGLDRLDLITGEFNHYQHDPQDPNSLDSNYVTQLHIDGAGDLYVITAAGVLRVYEASIRGFLPAFPEAESIFGEVLATAITHDLEGLLWVSLDSGKLLKVDSKSSEITLYSLGDDRTNYLQDALILDINADHFGMIWLATDTQGLVRFDSRNGTFSVLSMTGDASGPSHNSITSIYEDQHEQMWLGTAGGGLNRYDRATGEFVYYTTQDGMPSNQVFGILEDEVGSLWLSTGNGLVRFSPELGIIHTFDIQDGLQGNTFNRNAHAAGSGDALFFGGVNGLNAFYPRQIEKNEHVPPVIITKVSLFGEVLAQDIQDCSGTLTLAHDQNFLSFEFAVLDFTNPSHNQYAYILEGLNENYVLAGNRRHADYPNLAPGNYTLRLLGSNNDRVWNTTGVCLRIEIRPPFWATWWFIGLVGLFLAASVVVGYRWRLQNIEGQRRQLAVEVFERTEEIERRRQMAAGLSEVVRLLNTNQPLEKILDFIVQQALGLTEASKAAIFKRQGERVFVQACYPGGEIYHIDLMNPRSNSAQCLLESTFINRLLILSRIDPLTMKSDTHWELVSGDYHTALCTPLVVEDAVYGGLVLYYGEERVFVPDEIYLANTLADQAALAIANERLKNEVQDAAVTAERNRLARDLHDAVTQTLFSASLIAEVLPRIWEKDPQHAEQRLDELQQLTRGALGEMRTLLMELRPSALREADPLELFKHLMDAFTGRTGVPVKYKVDITGECEMHIDVKLVFYRIAQEGLSNILKHADANQVWFSFICDAEQVVLTLQDDGQGFDPNDLPPGHLGMNIMKERAEAVGADLSLSSQHGAGTILRLVWHFRENTLQ